jgi:hypothetical protein
MSQFRSMAFILVVPLLAVVLVVGTSGVAQAGQQVRPHQHTCDDPENPCYTAPQMHTYLKQGVHHFHHLSDGFRFPTTFIHQVQAAQAAWCDARPRWCQALWDRWHRQDKADGYHDCSPYAYWCHMRGYISCAGGSLIPYWACAPLEDQAARSQVDHELSDAQKVVISGSAAVIVTYLSGGTAPIVFGAGILQSFTTWIGLQ